MQHTEEIISEEQVIISPELYEDAIDWLQQHGVKAFLKNGETVVAFPCGTKKHERLPRLSSGMRIMYTLPDGFHIMVYHERYRDISMLFYEKVRREILWS